MINRLTNDIQVLCYVIWCFKRKENSRDQVVCTIMTTVSILSLNIIDQKFKLILHCTDIMARNFHNLFYLILSLKKMRL